MVKVGKTHKLAKLVILDKMVKRDKMIYLDNTPKLAELLSLDKMVTQGNKIQVV